MASADFSQFVVTTVDETVCETSRDKPASLSSSTCLIYAYGLRLPFGFHCFTPAYPPQTPYYQVSVRQATISLSLLPTYTSRCKPWESLWGSLATTPLVDFHHRLTACPSYKKGTGVNRYPRSSLSKARLHPIPADTFVFPAESHKDVLLPLILCIMMRACHILPCRVRIKETIQGRALVFV